MKPPADDTGTTRLQRLWTPWRMAYVGGAPEPGCVFCNALANDDDVASLIVHRGNHAFVILNLFPYNTGHLMVVPNVHVNDLSALPQGARAEMAELTASFCTGLRLVMGCSGLNTGINLGSAAGAGIADHLHQHIVPRWTGDANFMPIIGGTKVLPELLPATYGKIRAEVARQKAAAESALMVMFSPDRSSLSIAEGSLPRVALDPDAPVAQAVTAALRPYASTIDLLGWGGPTSTSGDSDRLPVLVIAVDPEGQPMPYLTVPLDRATALLSEPERAIVTDAVARFG